MILYWDNLITDKELFPGSYPDLYRTYIPKTPYRKTRKFDVAIYAIHSMARLPISHAVFNVEIDDINEKQFQYFEQTILDIWPDAEITRKRSTSIYDFQKNIDRLDDIDDDTVLYAGNADHVFISDVDTFMRYYRLLDDGRDNSALLYSHYFEMYHAGTLHPSNNKDIVARETIADKKDWCKRVTFMDGFKPTIAIYKKALLKEFVKTTKNYSIKRLDFIPYKIPEMEVYVPMKDELFRHYDGYSHAGIGSSDVPPLFIPDFYFEEEIRIRYGFDKYEPGYVNINPKNKYIFDAEKNQFGITACDMKVSLDNVPEFWCDRITETHVNPLCNGKELHTIAENEKQRQIWVDWIPLEN